MPRRLRLASANFSGSRRTVALGHFASVILETLQDDLVLGNDDAVTDHTHLAVAG